MKVVRKDPLEFLDDRFLQQVVKERRGVGDVPADARRRRAGGGARCASAFPGSTPRSITAASRSGSFGRFSRARSKKPYFLAMTAAGQSALNVQGLDTVVIDDTRFGNVIERGTQRAHPPAPRRQRDSADGRARARPRRGRTSVHPLRSRHRFSIAPTDGSRSSSWPAIRSGWRMTCADLGVARRRARSAGAARPRGVPHGRDAAGGARHHRERTAHALRQGGRSDAGGSAVGGAARATPTTSWFPIWP